MDENVISELAVADNTVKSIKHSFSKIFKSAWKVLAAILALLLIISVIKYSGYKKAQDVTVSLLEAVSGDRFEEYTVYSEKVDAMYLFFNPSHVHLQSVDGLEYDNTDLRLKAYKADKALGETLTEMGYDCYYASYFLKCTSIIEYIGKNVLIPYIVFGCLAIITLFTNVYFIADAKKAVIIDGDRVVCMKGKKTLKEFFIKDIKRVDAASRKGIAICGSDVKYKIKHLENADEIKTAIMDYLSEHIPGGAGTVDEGKQQSNADELKKYKELLDSGVITQEEFDAKKKQLLGI